MSIIPPVYKWAAVALAIALAGLAVARWDSSRLARAEKRGADVVQAKWARDREAQKDAALRQAAANAAETQRRLLAQKEAQDAYDKDLARVRADADAARAAASRLSGELAAFTAAHRAAAGNSAAPGNGQAAATALDLLANLLSRADREAGELAEFADAAHAAGIQCQRAYEALTP